MQEKAKVASLHVQDIMTAPVHSVNENVMIKDAIMLLLSKKVSGAPVVDFTGVVLSVVSDADLMQFAALGNMDQQLHYFMNKLPKKKDLVTVRKMDPFVEVFKQFLLNPVKRVLVVDGSGKLQGIVSRSNILKAFMTTQGFQVP